MRRLLRFRRRRLGRWTGQPFHPAKGHVRLLPALYDQERADA